MGTIAGMTAEYTQTLIDEKLDKNGIEPGDNVTVTYNPVTDKVVISASGGGPIGTTQAAGVGGTVGTNGFSWENWSFTKHDSWPGATCPTLVEETVDGPHFDPQEPGWYESEVNFNLAINSSGTIPPSIRLMINPDASDNLDSYVQENRAFVSQPIISQHNLQTTLRTGPFYHPGPGVGDHFLGAGVFATMAGITWITRNVTYKLTRVR